MLTPVERNELISRIRQLPAKVEAAVKNLGEEQLNTPYRKDGWTVRQVVHHSLGKSDVFGHGRR